MSAHTDPDDTLLRSLRAGKRRAFERVYRDYRVPIYNHCARMLGDREEAEDVTQEVFVKAFRALPGGTVRDLRPWLYRVATNACLNQLRGRKAGASGDGQPLEEIPAAVDGYAQAETVGHVEQTLALMNDRYRAALVLKDLQGLPSEEIAEALELSRGGADVLVHRARAAFRRSFAQVAGDTPAPASLGLVLAPLALPAVLQTMPHAVHLALPAGGLVAKLSAALTTKVAIGAAAAGLVIGGGIAIDQYAVQPTHDPAHAAVVSVSRDDTPIPVQPVADRTAAVVSLAHWAGHGCAPGDAACNDHTGATGHDAGDHTSAHDTGDHAGTTATAGHDAGEATHAAGATSSGATTSSHDAGTSGGSEGQTDHHSSSGTTSGTSGGSHGSSPDGGSE